MPATTSKTNSLLEKPLLDKLNSAKVALLSVFNKSGIEDLAKALTENGYILLSTGGTQQHLASKGFEVIDTSVITGFGELMGGRVKSLHPEIFAGILGERQRFNEADYDKPPFTIDTVVVNLYPFEAESQSPSFAEQFEKDPYHLLHFIDIGGSSLIRAAAKNYPSVNVLCDASQYSEFIDALKEGKGETTEAFRKKLALEAFKRSAGYDAAITNQFTQQLAAENPASVTLEDTVLPLLKIQDLRYGENPHQKAALYGLGKRTVDFECMSGKELSFNNMLDLQAAWNIVGEFAESKESACVIIKHNNPCGVALSKKDVTEAFERALDVDPLSAFGGVVGFNKPVDASVAKKMKDIFLEVIIAPEFSPEAVEILTTKKNLRLVKRNLPDQNTTPAHLVKRDIKQVSDDLFLVQQVDLSQPNDIDQVMAQDNLNIVTEEKPTPQQLADMIMAWKIVKHVKSNAIVLVKDGKAIGIGAGQTSRIYSLEHAIKIACDGTTGAVMASDAFLPNEDNIVAAAQAKLSAIIQPGGSIKDKDVIALANQHKISMIFTGIREFKH